MSYKSEVATKSDGKETWASNSQRFATFAEADAAGKELLSRWMAPHAHRVVESTDPVNYRFDFESYRSVPVDSAS